MTSPWSSLLLQLPLHQIGPSNIIIIVTDALAPNWHQQQPCQIDNTDILFRYCWILPMRIIHYMDHFLFIFSIYMRTASERWENVIYVHVTHDDVIKWKHFPRYWPFVRGIHRSPLDVPHKGQWRGALMFSFICAWTKGWVNNRAAGDLRHHRTHYVTVMV